MKWIKVKFDKYQFRIHAQKGRRDAVNVFLKEGTKTVAWLNFEYDFPLPEAKFSKKTNGIYLYYPIEMFTPIMETLRVEKPLYVFFNPELNWGYIGSTPEPVGEQEMESERLAMLN